MQTQNAEQRKRQQEKGRQQKYRSATHAFTPLSQCWAELPGSEHTLGLIEEK
ncbi:hypothetical protein AB4Y32_20565 [Paraburkholderia phymatum]|uniref:Uncharacterized protein n=1 Tax=Paraburkholderia phymatum TaxID=148447 RepID=A0ACC6U3F4_9BURK|nr:hypothetical protein [Paraburkholderia piptadeniae]